MSSYQYRDLILKMRRSCDRLIFSMGISIPKKDGLLYWNEALVTLMNWILYGSVPTHKAYFWTNAHSMSNRKTNHHWNFDQSLIIFIQENAFVQIIMADHFVQVCWVQYVQIWSPLVAACVGGRFSPPHAFPQLSQSCHPGSGVLAAD